MIFGCTTNYLNCRTLQKLGYNYIELRAIDAIKYSICNIKKANRIFNDTGMFCKGFYAFSSGNPVFVGPYFDAKQLREHAQRVCDIGAQLKIQSIGIGSPDARLLPNGFNIVDAEYQMMESLHLICNVAKQYNQLVLLEALNVNSCNFIVSSEHAFNLVDKISIDNLALVIDLYHMYLMKEDYSNLQPYLKHLKHLHISHWNKNRGYLTDKGYCIYKKFIKSALMCGYEGGITIESNTNNIYRDAKLSMKIIERIIME